MTDLQAPNLFSFAPSELSQDAFICWLLQWADGRHAAATPALHKAGLHFLNSLLAKHGKPAVQAPAIEIRRQFERIDVLARVDDRYVLVIEDKTHSSEHSGQLDRYLRSAGAAFKEAEILPIFIKTGDQSDYRKVVSAGYPVYGRKDFLAALEVGRKEGVGSDIFRDFHAYLEQWEMAVRSFKTLPLADWGDHAWTGFYLSLQEQFDWLDWRNVSNPAGGFLGAWWHFRPWRGNKAYLQIEQGPLCFKIASGEEPSASNDPAVEWWDKLSRAGEQLKLPPLERGRLRRGETMTIAKDLHWRVEANGKMDYAATLANLRAAQQRLDLALTLD